MSANFGRKLKLLLLPTAMAALFVFSHWQTRPGRLTLTTLTGEKISLPGQQCPVLLNFWASGCPACIEEMPRLERLYRRYHPKGLQLVAVAMPYDPPNRVMAFVHRHHPPYPVALDLSGTVSAAFRVHLIPTWILVGPDNRILWRHTGIPDMERLEPLLQTHLKRGNPPCG